MVRATYVSVWDGGIQIRSRCLFSKESSVVYDIETIEVDGLYVCEEQFVELPDGTKIKDFITEDELD
jgi:hypothetical protein